MTGRENYWHRRTIRLVARVFISKSRAYARRDADAVVARMRRFPAERPRDVVIGQVCTR